ncbi:MAG TPA: hypothetical protein VF456_24690 [Vicinamibacterales bacterium]
MRRYEKSVVPNRGWLWCAAGCFAVTMSVAGCSRQSAPISPSALFSHDETAHVHGSPVSDTSPDVASELAAVRAATAKYHDVSAALADGYQLGYKGVVTGCISNPTAGAMGYHYFNWAKMDDPNIVAGDPEVLVYHKDDDGALVLGAVEWVVPKVLWEQAGHAEAPVVFGQTLHVLNPVLNWYIEHAWIWTHNPSGLFADWNPNVSCP